MDEGAAYETLRPRLQGLGLDPQRVENVLNRGTPDVWYTHGAIEMKYLSAWPKRAETPVKIAFRPGQVPWLTRRWISGGASWIMLRVNKEQLLFSGFDALIVNSGLSHSQLRDIACWERKSQDWSDLGNWLTGNTDAMTIFQRARYLRLRACWSMERLAAEMKIEARAVRDGEIFDRDLANELIDFWMA